MCQGAGNSLIYIDTIGRAAFDGLEAAERDEVVLVVVAGEALHKGLVGDVVDGWRLRKSWYWDAAHDEILRLIETLPRNEKSRVADVPATAQKLADSVMAIATFETPSATVASRRVASAKGSSSRPR